MAEPAVRAVGIDHLVLKVADVERSVAWYHGLDTGYAGRARIPAGVLEEA